MPRSIAYLFYRCNTLSASRPAYMAQAALRQAFARRFTATAIWRRLTWRRAMRKAPRLAASRPDGGVVTQRTANPCTRVRFPVGPPAIFALPVNSERRATGVNPVSSDGCASPPAGRSFVVSRLAALIACASNDHIPLAAREDSFHRFEL